MDGYLKRFMPGIYLKSKPRKGVALPVAASKKKQPIIKGMNAFFVVLRKEKKIMNIRLKIPK
ncbi:hypothetical protein GCM10022395_21390 [Snuella lapsa]|uniref:Uncharacterized protein n=1 Tax=Snuella lapsa TaxID=870481 RepID=A0ABP6XT18_9FLAO